MAEEKNPDDTTHKRVSYRNIERISNKGISGEPFNTVVERILDRDDKRNKSIIKDSDIEKIESMIDEFRKDPSEGMCIQIKTMKIKGQKYDLKVCLDEMKGDVKDNDNKRN